MLVAVLSSVMLCTSGSHGQTCPGEAEEVEPEEKLHGASLMQKQQFGMASHGAGAILTSSNTIVRKNHVSFLCEGRWVLGKQGDSCEQACQKEELMCNRYAFVRRNDEVDTKSKMAQVVAALGRQCKHFETGANSDMSSPWFRPRGGTCTVSLPYRHPSRFSCKARPPKTKSQSRRLCWCCAVRHASSTSDRDLPTDIWTLSRSGCKCYFNESQNDCACCSAGACQCSATYRSRCAPCNAMWKCALGSDLPQLGQPSLEQQLPRNLVTALNVALEAKTYESQQQGIRAYLREVYRLPKTITKVQMVALLSAKLSEYSPSVATHGFEFPEGNDVEDWLSSEFLEEELFDLSKNVSNLTMINGQKTSPPVVLGLVSRGALVQKKLPACDWHVALNEFYAYGGGYGNWCGKQAMMDGVPQSFGGCTKKKAKKLRESEASIIKICDDNGLDLSCLRHDSGGYTEDLWGKATKSLCKVDADFQLALQNISMNSTFIDGLDRTEVRALRSAQCLLSVMPCLRYETKTHWTWCPSKWGGYACKEVRTDYYTHWPWGDYSSFKEDACGPTGCYQKVL